MPLAGTAHITDTFCAEDTIHDTVTFCEKACTRSNTNRFLRSRLIAIHVALLETFYDTETILIYDTF